MELSVHTFVSLDGVMQGPGVVQEDPSNGFERGGWLVPHSDAGQLNPVDGWPSTCSPRSRIQRRTSASVMVPRSWRARSMSECEAECISAE